VHGLSVVVPTHDTRELTLRCLESVAFLGEEGAQVILVDDGSRDGTAEAARAAHEWLEVLTNAEAQGFARSANRGLAAARGRLLLLLNSDTELDRGSFHEAVDAFARDPRLGVAGAALVDPDGSPQWSGGSWPTRAWMVGMASGVPALLGRLPGYRRLRPPRGADGGAVDWVTGAAMMIHRRAWEEAGPLDETYAFYGQDLELCDDAHQRGWSVRVVPGWRVMHVGGATIGRRLGASPRVHLGLLWPDLLLWTRRHRGPGWTARTSRLMDAAVSTRIGLRALARPFQGAGRHDWDRETRALRDAREAVRAMVSRERPPVS
jgi:N-acetylglucosaminyl-diphospho-decaprenol L-rhamnosyltransferase